MMRDNPNYPKIYESLRMKKYAWVRLIDRPKRIKITKIDWIPNPNNPYHPCIIYTGKKGGVFFGPSYRYKEVFLEKEKVVAIIKKDLEKQIKHFKSIVAGLNNKIKALRS